MGWKTFVVHHSTQTDENLMKPKMFKRWLSKGYFKRHKSTPKAQARFLKRYHFDDTYDYAAKLAEFIDALKSGKGVCIERAMDDWQWMMFQMVAAHNHAAIEQINACIWHIYCSTEWEIGLGKDGTSSNNLYHYYYHMLTTAEMAHDTLCDDISPEKKMGKYQNRRSLTT